MYKEWFLEKRGCFLDTTASVKQHVRFITDMDRDSEVVVCLHEVDDLVGKVMHIDDNLIASGSY